jgi:hypothetical protein
MAHRVISLPRSNWVAFGVKRTSTRAGHRTGFMSTRPSISGHRLGLASLTVGTVPPLPFQLPPFSSSRAKQLG